jgi:two-component system OmpR family response regulator
VLLLVEDDAILASATRRMLRNAGHDVVIAASATDGMAAVESVRFDLILCDLNLGDGTAIDVIGAMEPARPSPVLLLTGVLDERTDAIAARYACVVAVLAKPIEPASLRALVDRTLADAPLREPLRGGTASRTTQ